MARSYYGPPDRSEQQPSDPGTLPPRTAGDQLQWTDERPWRGPALYFETQHGRGTTTLWETDPTAAKSTPKEIVRFDPRLHPVNRGAFRARKGTFYFPG